MLGFGNLPKLPNLVLESIHVHLGALCDTPFPAGCVHMGAGMVRSADGDGLVLFMAAVAIRQQPLLSRGPVSTPGRSGQGRACQRPTAERAWPVMPTVLDGLVGRAAYRRKWGRFHLSSGRH